MRVNPADHFSDDIGEIGPYDSGDGQKRSDEFFRRFWNSGGCYGVWLMDGAKAGVGGTAVAALAARAEVKAWALVRTFGHDTHRRRCWDAKIPAVVVGFSNRAYAEIVGWGDRPDTEFAARIYAEFAAWRGAAARSINGYDSSHCVPHFPSDKVKLSRFPARP
jgi:hypothetical protein